MSSKKKVLENLQTALEMELAAVNQYLLHALVAEDWGLDKLAARMREEMQEEMGHVERFAHRIVFLNGNPELKPAKTPHRAQALEYEGREGSRRSGRYRIARHLREHHA